jgi:CheY-like chemotaxis protein
MIDPDLSWAEIDPLRFRQCLFNLIGNAVKFTAVGVVTVTARRDADAVIVEVRDTGIGIPESVKASLFQRFQQGDGSMTRTFGGTGLGLAITRRLAEAMGGGVRFDSTLWEGSSFWLSVQAPKVRKPVRPEPLPPAPAAALEGLKVLVVDDNATNLLIASRILAQWGAVVVTAPSGSAAIACVGTESFDLVLMDIQMPEMDGVETTRRLRQDSALPAETPIVALTANALDEQRRAYLAAGMNGVISKPIMPVVMLTEILRLLQTAQDVEAQVHSVCG